jgi:hypothetical protein
LLSACFEVSMTQHLFHGTNKPQYKRIHQVMYYHVWGVCVTNNNWFWIGWLDLLALRLQLQSIITAQNQWPPKSRSIPYWTTTVFSSIVTNDEWKIACDWIVGLPYEWRLTNALSFILVTWGETTRDSHLEHFMYNSAIIYVLFVATFTVALTLVRTYATRWEPFCFLPPFCPSWCCRWPLQ